jgi:hypothetical protein
MDILIEKLGVLILIKKGVKDALINVCGVKGRGFSKH